MPKTQKIAVKPSVRKGVYELYWRFAAGRQSAFWARQRGQPQPWTDDPILQRFKFCNVYRATDRVSQYLIRDVIYNGDNVPPDDLAFQIVAFRTFSNIETWQGLRAHIGHAPTLADLKSGAFLRALEAVKQQNGGLYTGAFILCANKAYGFDAKHRNHNALWEDMFVRHDAARRIRGANSLEQVVKFLQSFPLMGPFMAYQTAIDLNYSELINFSENDYTQAGPGALRGIAKCFEDVGTYSASDIIMMMTETQEREFERLGLDFQPLTAGITQRWLHAIDCQGLFCETDKYCREAAPHLLSARTRIKSKFTPQREVPPLFLPPKWGGDS
jgi:hypothetical protein